MEYQTLREQFELLLHMGMQQRRSADVIALEPTSILEWRFGDIKDKAPALMKELQKLALTHLRSSR